MRHLALLLALPAWADPIYPEDFRPADPLMAEIGQLLFYDPILSGNRNISCGTCHHHDHAGADGLSLGIGEGGEGVGDDRIAATGTPPIKRVPRNAPALWNLGHIDVTVLFHDGRLSEDLGEPSGFDSPAGDRLPLGLTDILAAQALFPLTSEAEMAGSPVENEIGGAAYDRIDYVWPLVAERVRTIPDYRHRFAAAGHDDVTIVEIAEALAAFINLEWRSHDSPYDAWLAGEGDLPADALAGYELFMGEAGCAACHHGPLFTDQDFHALGLPPFGPGRTRAFDPYARDVGRMGETDDLADAYAFRTPSLRNVALTAPYGHNGAYPTLEGIVRHHLDPLAALDAWDPAQAALPDAPWLEATDFVVWEDTREMARLRASVSLAPTPLTDAEIAQIVAFLESLTGEDTGGRLGRPEAVPSGLPVD